MAANLRARKKHGISQYVVKANVTSIFFKIYPIHISLDVSFLDFFLEKELKETSTNLYATLTQIDSKSASEESHVCIAIASLYISLSGLS